MSSKVHRNHRTRLLVWITALTVLPAAMLYALFVNAQTIADWYALIGYEPNQRIAQIRNDAGLSDYGETLFYINEPQLVGRDDFTKKCPVQELTIVLGCYHSSRSIFLFDVDDNRSKLSGIEEVTAAHEMLHAAYDRLSVSERNQIDRLLLDVYSNTNDKSLIETVELYRASDPSTVPGELHSIIGTEIRDLPVELEQYYSKYFADRTKVVNLAEKYGSVFSDLRNQIADYDSRLDDLSKEIIAVERKIEQQDILLRNKGLQLESLRSSPAEYNSHVGAYNDLVYMYNAEIEHYKKLVKKYNQVVEARNAISVEQRSLFDAIDANALPK